MVKAWLTIIGLGEDGPDGLPPASLKALDEAEVIMGPARHMALVPDAGQKRITWPVPFADGVPLLEQHRGRPTVVLASGNPFWFGAGTVIARHLDAEEWRALPGPSVFSLAAARLGWALETTTCLGLHAAPHGRLRPHLALGQRMIVTLRDGAALADLMGYLSDHGFSETSLHILEALGGPRERLRRFRADDIPPGDVLSPVAVALDVKGGGGIPHASGRSDSLFANDGQITKRPVRALTLSALAPRPGEMLWDIGAGSGSIAIEWLMAHPATRAVAIEAEPARAARIADNARALGQDRLQTVLGSAPSALADLPPPDAVFVGGGCSRALLDWLGVSLAPGTRLVANAVTLETEALLGDAHSRLGGTLMRFEISESQPLGTRRGWKSSYPIVQWSVTL